MPLSSTQLADLYYWLLLTRRVEEHLRSIYKSQSPDKKVILGQIYLSTYQEATSVGSAFAARPTDWISRTHRENGALLVHGRATMTELFANYLGRATGPSRGHDSAANFGMLDRYDLTKHPFMGLMLLPAIGMAWEIVNQKNDQVILGYLGDGATSEGFVHEALNGAGLWKLPIIFICNNNQWAISTPVEKQVAGGSIAKRAEGYGFPGVTVDGTDILAVYEATREAIERARGGKGPTLIEAQTFRFSGHAEHDDPTVYIPKETWELWSDTGKDPLQKFQKLLQAEGVISQEDVKSIEEEIREDIYSSWQEALEMALPDPESVEEGVYGGTS